LFNLNLIQRNQPRSYRLQQQGVNTDEAPALFRDLAKILESGIGIDAAGTNEKLYLLG
jgi:hypothetical protein